MKTDVNVIDILQQLDIMFPSVGCELIYHNLYELSIAVILSAQTTDKNVNKITPILFNKYSDFCALSTANFNDVYDIIKPLGLANNKAKNIINLSKVMVEEYNSIIPDNLNILMSLPGIGRKTANVILSEGYNIERIAVDTHVERVSKRLALVDINANVLEVEEKLMELIPSNMWHHSHHLLLFFGRYFCTAKNPNCIKCPFKNQCILKKD